MEHNQIHFRAEFTIEEGKIEEFKKLVQALHYSLCKDGHRYSDYSNGKEAQFLIVVVH